MIADDVMLQHVYPYLSQTEAVHSMMSSKSNYQKMNRYELELFNFSEWKNPYRIVKPHITKVELGNWKSRDRILYPWEILWDMMTYFSKKIKVPNKLFESNQFPNVKELQLTNFTRNFNEEIFPSSLKVLYLPYGFIRSYVSYFPLQLTELRIPNNKELPIALPISLLSLDIGTIDCTSIRTLLPRTLTWLRIDYDLYGTLEFGDLPPSLLTFMLPQFNKCYVKIDGMLPHGLTQLFIGDKWNQPITNTTFPPSLKKLSLGSSVNHYIAPGMLPDTLSVLVINSPFPYILDPEIFSSNLKVLVLKFDVVREIPAGLPVSLQWLEIHGRCRITKHSILLLTSLTHFSIITDYAYRIRNDFIPPQLNECIITESFGHQWRRFDTHSRGEQCNKKNQRKFNPLCCPPISFRTISRRKH